MADKSKIEWTDATWNPIRGCSRVSEGCRHCYAEGVAARFSGPGQPYEGLAKFVSVGTGSKSSAPRSGHSALGSGPGQPPQSQPLGGPSRLREPRWTGKLVQAPEATLTQPLRWKRPRRIFVNSMSDLFHEGVPDAWIDRIFAVMAYCQPHVFQVLTKRPERMRAYLSDPLWRVRVTRAYFDLRGTHPLVRREIEAGAMSGFFNRLGERPEESTDVLPNVWLGVSCEDQVTADTRIPYLLSTPAAVRFISAEPLLGPIDLTPFLLGRAVSGTPPLTASRHDLRGDAPVKGATASRASGPLTASVPCDSAPTLDWVIVGGESGPNARPMHPDWARSLRDQCAQASRGAASAAAAQQNPGVAFFFKQWGEWIDADSWLDHISRDGILLLRDGKPWQPPQPLNFECAAWMADTGGFRFEHQSDGATLIRLGKRAAGRLLDGVEHNGMPRSPKWLAASPERGANK